MLESRKFVNLPPAAILESIKSQRKPPRKRIFQEDQMANFKKKDVILCFEDIISKGPMNCEKGLNFERKDNCLLIYKMEYDGDNNVPQVDYCIRVDETLHVKLFHRNIPMSLPNWFRQGRNTVLTGCSMLQNLINHMKQSVGEKNSILSELQQIRYTKYLSTRLRFFVMLFI